MMSWARQIHLKSPAELHTMREAGRINASVLNTVRELLQPGVSTADLNAAAEVVLKKHGCISPFKGYGQPPFPASITVSINQELVHGIPSSKRKLQSGGSSPESRSCTFRSPPSASSRPLPSPSR